MIIHSTIDGQRSSLYASNTHSSDPFGLLASQRVIGMKLKVALGMLCAFLLTAPAAFGAVGSAQRGYGGTAGVTEVQVQSGVASTSSNLPFTGLDLMLLVGGGLLLVLIGVGLHWVSRPRASA